MKKLRETINAYWRQPNGYFSNDSKFAPTALLHEIGRRAEIQDTGRPIWRNFHMDPYLVSLRAALAVMCGDDEINEKDVEKFIWIALKSEVERLGGKTPIQSKDFLLRVSGEASKFLEQPAATFFMVSSLSVPRLTAKKIAVGGSVIRPIRNRSQFPLPSTLRQLIGEKRARRMAGCRYQLISIEVEARSRHEAVSKAFMARDVLRALWTLMVTRGRWSTVLGGPRTKPLATIQAGSIATLHESIGTAINDIVWVDTDAQDDCDLYGDTSGWPVMEKGRKRLVAIIERLPYGKELERLLARYVQALDQPNHDLAFLQLWNLLEKITNTVGTSRIEETLKRAVWLYKSPEIPKSFLDCMRVRRNLFVHSSRTNEESDQAAQIIKSIIDVHLDALVDNRFKASSLEDYAMHLALPATSNELLNMGRRIRRAISIFSR